MKLLINYIIIAIMPFFLMDSQSYTERRLANPHEGLSLEAYCNTRFNFCLNYPEEILTKIKEGDNEDGVDLFNDAGDIEVTAYGSYNVLDWNTQDIYDFNVESMLKETPQMEVVSVAVTDNEYIATLHRAGNVIYQHGYKFSDYYIILTMKVPEGKKEWLDMLKESVVLTTDS